MVDFPSKIRFSIICFLSLQLLIYSMNPPLVDPKDKFLIINHEEKLRNFCSALLPAIHNLFKNFLPSDANVHQGKYLSPGSWCYAETKCYVSFYFHIFLSTFYRCVYFCSLGVTISNECAHALECLLKLLQITSDMVKCHYRNEEVFKVSLSAVVIFMVLSCYCTTFV